MVDVPARNGSSTGEKCLLQPDEMHLLLLQVDHDLWRAQRHLLHEVQVLVPADKRTATCDATIQCAQV